MTVAPTAGVAHIPRSDAPSLPLAHCGSCGEGVTASAAYCTRCGTRVATAGSGGRPDDVAATRSLRLAVLVLLVNTIVGGGAFAVVFLVSDSLRFTEAALVLEALRFLIVGSLIAASVRAGIRGLRETAGGRLGRRWAAITGIAVSGVIGILITGSLVAVTALALLK